MLRKATSLWIAWQHEEFLRITKAQSLWSPWDQAHKFYVCFCIEDSDWEPPKLLQAKGKAEGLQNLQRCAYSKGMKGRAASLQPWKPKAGPRNWQLVRLGHHSVAAHSSLSASSWQKKVSLGFVVPYNHCKPYCSLLFQPYMLLLRLWKLEEDLKV